MKYKISVGKAKIFRSSASIGKYFRYFLLDTFLKFRKEFSIVVIILVRLKKAFQLYHLIYKFKMIASCIHDNKTIQSAILFFNIIRII